MPALQALSWLRTFQSLEFSCQSSKVSGYPEAGHLDANPHLSLQDLQERGVSFQLQCQAVWEEGPASALPSLESCGPKCAGRQFFLFASGRMNYGPPLQGGIPRGIPSPLNCLCHPFELKKNFRAGRICLHFSNL